MKKMVILVLTLILLGTAVGGHAETYLPATVYIASYGGMLNLRATGSTSANVLGYVQHGDKVHVLLLGETWSKISIDETDKVGYIKTSYLRLDYQVTLPTGEAVTVAPTMAQPAEIKEWGNYRCDLDGDGQMETLSFYAYATEYDEYATFRITEANQQYIEFISEIISMPTLYIADLDHGAGGYELLISGDVMSNDFQTWGFRYESGALKPIAAQMNGKTFEVLSGGIDAIENGTIRLFDNIDMLGTWQATRNFTFRAEGRLVTDDAEPWRISLVNEMAEDWNEFFLSLIADLPVTFPDGTRGMLPTGTRLLIQATDLRTYADCITSDGTKARIAVASSREGWGVDIDGRFESDYFGFLPYAG